MFFEVYKLNPFLKRIKLYTKFQMCIPFVEKQIRFESLNIKLSDYVEKIHCTHCKYLYRFFFTKKHKFCSFHQPREYTSLNKIEAKPFRKIVTWKSCFPIMLLKQTIYFAC